MHSYGLLSHSSCFCDRSGSEAYFHGNTPMLEQVGWLQAIPFTCHDWGIPNHKLRLGMACYRLSHIKSTLLCFFPGAMGRTSDDEWRWLVTPFGVNKLERNGCEDPDTKHIHTYISHTHTHIYIYIVICANIYVWYMYIHIFIMRNLYAWFKRSSLWLLSHRYTRFQWQNWRARFFQVLFHGAIIHHEVAYHIDTM